MAERDISRTARRGRTGLWGGLAALGLALALLTGVIRFLACSPGEMEGAMRRFAPPEATGLPEREYPAMAAHITGYLAGREDSFQYELPAPGGERMPCFHDYELAHMADCRRLIRLDGIVCILAAAAAAAGIAGVLRAGKTGLRKALAGAETGLWILGILAAGLVLWAAVDFDGLFVTFHRLAFRNDLWLLDPRTDLLIRLMPLPLFVHLGLRGLGLFATGMILITAGTAGLSWHEKKAGRR